MGRVNIAVSDAEFSEGRVGCICCFSILICHFYKGNNNMLEIMHLKEKKMAMNVRCMNMLFTKSLKALRIALAAA